MTGITQLAALLLAPLFGSLGARYSQTGTLALGAALGVGGFAALAMLAWRDELLSSEHGQGSKKTVWVAAVAMGASLICSTVVGLALVAQVRVRHVAQSRDLKSQGEQRARRGEEQDAREGEAQEREQDEGEREEVAGALAGSYSACGGLGILFVSTAGGELFDSCAHAPFTLMAACNAALLLVALVACRRTRTRRSSGGVRLAVQ